MADSVKSLKRKIAVGSDSDDDEPLSALKNRVQIKKEAATPTKNGTSKSSTASASAVTVKTEKKTPVKKSEASDSDSEDDVPIAVLMKRKHDAAVAAAKVEAEKALSILAKHNQKTSASPPKKSKVSGKSSSKTDDAKKKVVIAKKPVPTASKTVSSGPATKIQGDPLESSQLTEQFYSTLDKGKLCQQLLRRWWYALSWPQEGVMELCPKGYEPLEGFPGVFVGTTVSSAWLLFPYKTGAYCPCPIYVGVLHFIVISTFPS